MSRFNDQLHRFLVTSFPEEVQMMMADCGHCHHAEAVSFMRANNMAWPLHGVYLCELRGVIGRHGADTVLGLAKAVNEREDLQALLQRTTEARFRNITSS